MLIELLAAAGGEAAPQNKFGFMEAHANRAASSPMPSSACS